MFLNIIKKKYKDLALFDKKKDTGNTKVQIALLTYKINNLQKHFAIHKKDYCSRKGLLTMVSKRRKLLNYLKKKNMIIYTEIINKLQLRK
ncbi:30S ribosomal protein S15 [Buchnera aphidicola (Taiwanaphis decaspermi)]|uniref:30S ribosomal protein S15 n=1 Tax=Buchnera aphidicola TaxID=9 RepID=UPI0031B83071